MDFRCSRSVYALLAFASGMVFFNLNLYIINLDMRAEILIFYTNKIVIILPSGGGSREYARQVGKAGASRKDGDFRHICIS